MKHIVTIIILSNQLVATDLIKYQKLYKEGIEKIENKSLNKISLINQAYFDNLNTLLKKVQKSGDLEKTTIVMGEIQRFESTYAINKQPLKLDELNTLHKHHVKLIDQNISNDAKQIIILSNRYDQALEKLQKQLVISGDLENATNVKNIREETTKSKILLNAQKSLNPPDSKTNQKNQVYKKNVVVKKAEENIIKSQKSLIKSLWINNHLLISSRTKVVLERQQKTSSNSYWLIEYLENNEVRIRTYRKPYLYLYIDNNNLSLTDKVKDHVSTKWKFIKEPTFIKIQNSAHEKLFIHTENNRLQVSEIQHHWHSIRWEITK